MLKADATVFAKPEAIKAALAAIPRKSGLLPDRGATEEASVCVVYPFQRRTLQVRRQYPSFFIRLAPLGQSPALIVVGARYARLLVRIDPLFQRGVIKLPLGLENALEGPVLAPARQQAVFVGEEHVDESRGCPS